MSHGSLSLTGLELTKLSHTSRKSSSSLGRTLPCRQRFRNHRSFMKSSRKLCLNCWDSCTRMFFSWLQNFCSSRRWRLRLCSSNSRLSSALCWSSFSCQDRSEQGRPQLIPDPDKDGGEHQWQVPTGNLCPLHPGKKNSQKQQQWAGERAVTKVPSIQAQRPEFILQNPHRRAHPPSVSS